jgi:hypothetical protein
VKPTTFLLAIVAVACVLLGVVTIVVAPFACAEIDAFAGRRYGVNESGSPAQTAVIFSSMFAVPLGVAMGVLMIAAGVAIGRGWCGVDGSGKGAS